MHEAPAPRRSGVARRCVCGGAAPVEGVAPCPRQADGGAWIAWLTEERANPQDPMHSIHDHSPLAEIRHRILQAEGGRVRQIILHGSRARGQARQASDFDVLVVVDDPLGDWVERSMQLRQLFYDRDYAVDVQVFGATEFEESRGVAGTLAYPADTLGVRIYEKPRGGSLADRPRIPAAGTR